MAKYFEKHFTIRPVSATFVLLPQLIRSSAETASERDSFEPWSSVHLFFQALLPKSIRVFLYFNSLNLKVGAFWLVNFYIFKICRICLLRVADLLKILCKLREIGASIQFTMHHGMQMFPSNRAKQRRWLQKASNKELSTNTGRKHYENRRFSRIAVF